jgi:hypothetical protein
MADVGSRPRECRSGPNAGIELAYGIRKKAAETFHRVGGGLVNLEEAIGSCEFQDDGSVRRKVGKLQVAIATAGLGHALEEHVDAGGVDLSNGGEIEDDLRSVNVNQWTDFVMKLPGLARIQQCGNSFNYNRSTRFHIASLKEIRLRGDRLP